MMPVVTIPLTQYDLKIRLGTDVFIGALGLSLQAAQTRLKLRHDIEHTFQVAGCVFKPLQCFLTAYAIQPYACGLFKETAAFICLQRQGCIYKSLTENGIGSFRESRCGEQL